MAYVGMSKARLDDTRSDANPTPSTRRPLKLNTAKDESRLLPPLPRLNSRVQGLVTRQVRYHLAVRLHLPLLEHAGF